MTLYRAVSEAEQRDYDGSQLFRTGRNTLEGKQFFKTEEAVREFVQSAQVRDYHPTYSCILHIDIDKDCLEKVPSEQQELDRFEAMTIYEDNLIQFNKCVNFVTRYDI